MESLEEFCRLTWVTDPHLSILGKFQERILYLLNDSTIKKISYSEQELDRGLVLYDVSILSSNKELLHTLIAVIGEVSFEPVEFSLSLPERNLTVEEQAGLESIILAVVEKLCFVELNYIQSIRRSIPDKYIPNSIHFFPRTTNDDFVYKHPATVNAINNKLVLAEYIGYQVLSDDLLARYVMETEFSNVDTELLDIEDITCIRIDKDLAFPKFNDIRDQVDMVITSLKREGCFSHRISIHNLNDWDYLADLANLWDIELLNSLGNNQFRDPTRAILKTDVDFLITPQQWLLNSLERIKNGSLPLFMFSGQWVDTYNNSLAEYYGIELAQSRANYGAQLAYSHVVEDYPSLLPQSINIIVAPDLTISAPFETYSQAKLFKQRYFEVMARSGNWITEPISDLKELILKRWQAIQTDPEQNPLLIDVEKGIKPLLILDSIGRDYYEFTEPTSADEASLITAFHQAYPGTSNLSLDELLMLIPVDNQYIPLAELESSTKPLSVETRFKMQLHIYGLQGLYTIGPLKGLYENVPFYNYGPIDIGIPVIYDVPTDTLFSQYLGPSYVVEIDFGCESINLMQIVTADKYELERLMNILWPCGYFLSPWSNAVYKNKSNVKTIPLPTVDPILIQAGDSKADGELALLQLQSAANTCE